MCRNISLHSRLAQVICLPNLVLNGNFLHLAIQYLGTNQVFSDKVAPARNHIGDSLGHRQVSRLLVVFRFLEILKPLVVFARLDLNTQFASQQITHLDSFHEIKCCFHQTLPGLAIRRDTLVGNNKVTEQKRLSMKSHNAKTYHAKIVTAKTVQTIARNSNRTSGIDAPNYMTQHVPSADVKMNHLFDFIKRWVPMTKMVPGVK